MSLQPYDVVRVVSLNQPADAYDGWLSNQQRRPRIGEVGTIVEVLTAAGLPNVNVVESTDEHGATIWLSDFRADELEVVDA